MAANLTGLTMRFARFAADLRYEDLPVEVVDKAKVIVRDSLGIQIAGSAASEPCRRMVELVKEWGGAGQATIVGHGIRVPAPQAALCNAMMAHSLQRDDIHVGGMIKTGAVVVPTAFAAAELSGAAGKAFLAALVAGFEIAIRVSKSISPGARRRSFHASGTVGGLAAAATSAKLLGCDAEAIAWAMWLAGSQTAGLVAFLDDSSMVKPTLTGKAAFNGVQSGIMASRGFTGPKVILEGKEGFFNAFTDAVRVEDLLNGFGERFVIMEVGLKPHAACRHSHTAIDLAQQLYHEDSVRLADVEEATVSLCEISVRHTDIPECPTFDTAMGSTNFAVALALAKGDNGLATCWEGFEDAAIRAAAKRVRLCVESEFGATGRAAIIEVRLKDGRSIRRRQDLPKGEPSVPLTEEELARKYLRLAGLVMEESQARKIEAVIMAIEDQPRAGIVPELTAPHENVPALRAARRELGDLAFAV